MSNLDDLGIGTKYFWRSALLLNLTETLLKAESSRGSIRRNMVNRIIKIVENVEKEEDDEIWLEELKDLKNWAEKILINQ